MKKMMGLVIYGGILFGLSAGGAWFLRAKHLEQLQEVRSEHADPEERLVAATTDLPDVLNPHITGTAAEDVLRKVPIRTNEITVPELVRYGMGLKERDAAIHEREKALERVEAQYGMMLTDIKEEKREIEGLLVQAREQRKAADEILKRASVRQQEANALLQRANSEQKEAKTLMEQMDEARRESSPKKPNSADSIEMVSGSGASDEDRATNLKQLSEVMQGMTPTVGASMLGNLMDDGDTELAVELISRLDERKLAGILDAMSAGNDVDSTNKVSELIKRFTQLKREPRKKAR